jgi:hypothetical protein
VLTGVGYDKVHIPFDFHRFIFIPTISAQLNYLHRMAARVVFVLLWTHAAGKVRFAFLLLRHNFFLSACACSSL